LYAGGFNQTKGNELYAGGFNQKIYPQKCRLAMEIVCQRSFVRRALKLDKGVLESPGHIPASSTKLFCGPATVAILS